jgi:ATP-binding cassette, subfamily B, bacterial
MAGIWKFYFGTFVGYRKKLILSTFINIFQPIVLLPIVLLIRYIFDEIIPNKDLDRIVVVGIAIFVLYLVSNSISLLSQKIILKTVKTAILKLRAQIVNKLYLFSRSFYDTANISKLHTVVVQDTNRLDFSSNIVISSLIPALIISIALCCILMFLNIKLFLLIIIMAPLITFFGRLSGNRIKVWTNKSHRLFESITIGLLSVLRIMNLTVQRSSEKYETDIQLKNLTMFRDVSFKHAWVISIHHSLQNSLIAFSGVLVLVVGGIMVINEVISLGNLVSFYVATGMLKTQMSIITRSIPIAIEGYESLITIHDLYCTDYDTPYNGKKEINFVGNIKLKSVCFSYDKNELLNDINVTLLPGSITAISGPNGSGKSTIASLIMGFYKPHNGSIYADGHDYKSIDISHLRKKIGFVPQDPIIFPASIQENIIYGYPNLDKTYLNEAVSAANIFNFIEELEFGYDTFLGEDGILLSGGECQGIAIARALLLKPKLLILDEPTNNLDEEKVESLISNLKNLSFNPSILIISHNKRVQKLASQILLIKETTLINKNIL